ncbi:helicase-exonuclease AddAB subunit AddB [Caldicellulosiruptoraceae bacterium PP1]
MSLRFIYGRAGCGKTHFCLNSIKDDIDNLEQRLHILLVPEQFTLQAERELISVLKNKGIIKTEVLSFRRLTYRILNNVGRANLKNLDSASKNIIIYDILKNLKDKLNIFSNIASKQGFVEEVSELISEFKRSNISLDILMDILEKVKDDKTLYNKLNDFYLIYNEYQKEINNKYHDSEDIITLALSKLDDLSIYNEAEIWIDGFSYFTPQEYRIIEQLLKKAKRVNITLCIDSLEENPTTNFDIFQGTRKIYKKITKIAQGNNIEIEDAVNLNSEVLYRFKDSPEIAHLEKNLYSYPYEIYEKTTTDITLFTSKNMYAEVEDTAREIISLVRDKEYRFKDIAIITGNLSEYQALIENTFGKYNIPYFIDRRIDIITHPIVRLIMSVLDIFIENWSYESVFGYLKTGLTGISQARIDILENYVLEHGIRGNLWTSNKEWDMTASFDFDDIEETQGDVSDEGKQPNKSKFLEHINKIKNDVSSPLLRLMDNLNNSKNMADFIKSIYDFLCDIKLPKRIKNYVRLFEKNNNIELANQFVQVWNIVVNVFDQIVEILGDDKYTIKECSDILELCFKEYNIGAIPAFNDQVLIGTFERSKSHEVKALFILGANDGAIPSTSTNKDLLIEKDRRKLSEIGYDLINNTKINSIEEQFLIYKTFTTANKIIRISFPIADLEGNTLRPSTILSRIKSCFKNISEKSDIVPIIDKQKEIELISTAIPTFSNMVLSLRGFIDDKEISSLWYDVYKWFYSKEEWHNKCQRIIEMFKYKNIIPPISTEKMHKLLINRGNKDNRIVFSISKLESYSACPFAFFVQYILKAKERKIFNLNPIDIGNFAHKVIETVSIDIYKNENNKWNNIDMEKSKEKVNIAINKLLSQMERSSILNSTMYRTYINRFTKVLERSVYTIAKQISAGEFLPDEFEVVFDEKGKYHQIEIEIEKDKKVYLTGRIDRIDIFKENNKIHFRIIDYKTGKKSFSLLELYYGLQIQLITYLIAIWDRFSKNKNIIINPAGMFYFTINDPIIRLDKMEPIEEIEKEKQKELKLNGLMIDDIKILKAMDCELEENKYSFVIPVSIKKDNTFTKNSSVISIEDFKKLKIYISNLIKSLCNNILQGNVNIMPYKYKSNTPCEYCKFSSVCQFDNSSGNSYRNLTNKKDDELWQIIRGSEENEQMDQ